MTHHVVGFSGGVTSWAAARLVRDRTMKAGDELTLLFSDTLIESPDVYMFLEEAAEDIGEPVTRIADGRTPWELFEDEHLLGNNSKAICSRILKRDLIGKWREKHCDRETSLHHVGLDWTEINRFESHKAALAGGGWVASAPMIEHRVAKPDAVKWAQSRGLPLPSAYRDGFGHANCAGMCVRAGIGHWTRLLATHPDRFAEAEGHEARFRARFGDFSILRDRGGGETVPMPLSELRRRIEERACGMLDFEEEGGCGCAL